MKIVLPYTPLSSQEVQGVTIGSKDWQSLLVIHLRDTELAKPSRISWSADGANLSRYRPSDIVSSQIAASVIAWLVPRVESYTIFILRIIIFI